MTTGHAETPGGGKCSHQERGQVNYLLETQKSYRDLAMIRS